MYNKYERAFITLLSTANYISPVLVLNKSLRSTHSQYELVVAIVERIADEVTPILKQENISYEIIPEVNYTQEACDHWAPYTTTIQYTASKLSIFGLRQYQHLIYIDCDVLILQNIDNLFDEYPVNSILWDEQDNLGFSGLFSFCPANYRVEWLMDIIHNEPIVDGDLIGWMFRAAMNDKRYRIPETYLLHIMMIESGYPADNAKVIHFCLNKYKPWLVKIEENSKNILGVYATLIYKYMSKYNLSM